MLHLLASDTGQIGRMNGDIFRVDRETGLAQTYVLVCMKVVCDPRSPDKILERNKKAMYIQRNIEVHSCNSRCSGKAIILTQTVCFFVALVIQHAM
jgi:hypothetical protein